MAVTGPTPPTPPTPPVVPKVTLGGQEAAPPSQGAPAASSRSGGADAGEAGRGTQGQASGEAQAPSADAAAEEQARSSVAQGNGALSKTTSTTAAERAAAAREAARQLRGEPRDSSGSQADSAETAVRQEASAPFALPVDPAAGQTGDRESQRSEAATAAPPADEGASSLGSHGGILWGLGISILLAAVLVCIQAFRRRGGSARRRRAAPDMNLTGQTADEVLRALEAQQAAQLKSAQAKASRGEPREAAAADRYRAQAEPPPKTAQPVQPAKAARRNPEDKDAPRFEVRI